MSAALPTISPADAQTRLANGSAMLVDIREADEFARTHIPGAVSHPLSTLDGGALTGQRDRAIIFACRSGMRTAGACDRLAAQAPGDAFILEGGLDAWAKAGLPVAEDRKAPMELNRQVQIAAGLLILAGIALGFSAGPGWFGLSAFVGAGLTFAGITGTCAMARLLILAPWNRRPAGT